MISDSINIYRKRKKNQSKFMHWNYQLKCLGRSSFFKIYKNIFPPNERFSDLQIYVQLSDVILSKFIRSDTLFFVDAGRVVVGFRLDWFYLFWFQIGLILIVLCSDQILVETYDFCVRVHNNPIFQKMIYYYFFI